MHTSAAELNVYSPARYRIRARGVLEARWSGWLSELNLVIELGAEDAAVTLRGTLRDQAELMGVLNQLHQQGLALISVELVAEASNAEQS